MFGSMGILSLRVFAIGQDRKAHQKLRHFPPRRFSAVLFALLLFVAAILPRFFPFK
jgi:hypothetical protein